jgi:hypothetical protein
MDVYEFKLTYMMMSWNIKDTTVWFHSKEGHSFLIESTRKSINDPISKEDGEYFS